MKRLLLAAAAVALIAVPTLSSAQPAQNRGGGREAGNQQRDRGENRTPMTRRGVPGPERPAAAPRERRAGPAPAPRQAERPQQDRRPQIRRGVPGPDNRGAAGPDRRADRAPQYRDNRNAPRFGGNYPGWDRNNRDWWRGRPEFRGYSGVRSGFWFAPSYGYIRVDPRYYDRSWRRGDYVPQAYRRYSVADPFIYGLDWPPPGYAWVYLGHDIVLMQLATGLIIDVLPDFY